MGIFSWFKRKKEVAKPESLNDLATAVANEQDKSFERATASLNLQDLGLQFDDGIWKAETVGELSSAKVEITKNENIRLVEENNMLKLKITILLDMLSETTAESHILERERNDAIRVVRKSLMR